MGSPPVLPWLRRHLALTLALPLLGLYWVIAHLAAWLVTFMVIPSHLLAQKL